MKKRKIEVMIVIAIIIVGIVGIKVKREEQKEEEPKKTVAIMIREGEEEEYKEYKENIRWPDIRYKYTEAKCVDIEGEEKKGIVSFDHTNWEAIVETEETVYCTLYFDKANPEVELEATEIGYDYIEVEANPKDIEGTITKYEFQIGKEAKEMEEWREGELKEDRRGKIRYEELEEGTDYYIKVKVSYKLGGEEREKEVGPYIYTTKDREPEIEKIELKEITWEKARVETKGKRGSKEIGSYCYEIKEGAQESEEGIKWEEVECESSNMSTDGLTHQKEISGLKEGTTYTIFVKAKDTGKTRSINTGRLEITTKIRPRPTVTYNNNGGSGCNTKQVTYGGTYGDMCIPTRAGYDFAGWYTDATGGNKIETWTVVSNASNHTIYAHWNAATYTVTYNNNGGSGCNTKQVTYGGTYGDMCIPTRAGYDFAGWYTEASGGSKIETWTTVSNASNHTIYAHWNAATYTVTYNNNGGSGCNTKQVTYGGTYGDMCSPTRADHYFTGWYTEASGGSKIETWTTVSNASNHTIYAHWSSMPVRVYYYVNGGSINSNGFTSTSGRVIRNGGEYYGVINYGTSADLANYNNADFINITRAGYMAKDDAHWNTASNGSGTSFSQSTSYSYGTYKKYATNKTTYYELKLYVNWIQKPIRICFHPNGGSLTDSAINNGYGLNSSGYIAHNGETFCKMVNYGGSLGTNGLPDYGNAGALQISNKANGMAADPEQAWRKRSNHSIILSQKTNYTYNQLKAWVTSDDEETNYFKLYLEVNWITNPCSTWNQSCSGGKYNCNCTCYTLPDTVTGLNGNYSSCGDLCFDKYGNNGLSRTPTGTCTWVKKTCKNTTCKTYKYAW